MAILATGRPPEDSLLPGYQVISLFILKAWLFRQTIRFYQYRHRVRLVAEYFSVERNLAVLALILFGLDVYLLDLQYYLRLLPFSEQLPTLVDLTGNVDDSDEWRIRLETEADELIVVISAADRSGSVTLKVVGEEDVVVVLTAGAALTNLTEVASAVRCWRTTLSEEGPTNGGWPASISYSTQPRE